MKKNDRILVLGGKGLVGSSIVRTLASQGYENVLAPGRNDLDLFKQQAVVEYFKEHRPSHVFMAAARVGGIHANNTYSADFIFQNLQIEVNTFQAAFESKVEKFLFLGSSCIYPKNCPQPIKEEYLLTSTLEPTNEGYALAKIAGLKMAEHFKKQYGVNFFSAMPTNIYGIHDNYHPQNGHVIPALIARMKEAIDKGASTFEVWGTGTPRREFLYVDDLASACIFLMNTERELPSYVNVGTGEDISIKDLAILVAKIMNFKGEIVFNSKYPDGTMLKRLDVSKLHALGWKHQISLEEGIRRSVEFFLNTKNIRQK